MKFNRRQALAAAASMAAGFVAGPSTASDKPSQSSGPTTAVAEPPELAIVDTHQHLWDLDVLRLKWVGSDGPLSRSFLPADYEEAAQGLGVVQAVYMEVAADTAELAREAEYAIDLCRRQIGPTVAAVIGGRPAEEGFADYVRRFGGSRYVKGIRHIIRDEAVLRSNELVRGLQLVGKIGWSFDLCVPPPLLEAGFDLVRRCPETRFILDHCGNADPMAFRPASRQSRPPQHDANAWKRGIERLASCDRVVCKISGIVSRMPADDWSTDDLAPVINFCLDCFGPERVMFAGDWPVCTRAATLRQWVAAIGEVVSSRSTTDQRRLFHDNAVNFYRLPNH